jgi:hypothetical protein
VPSRQLLKPQPLDREIPLHNVATANGDDAELLVVDLARGSERTGRRQITGARLKKSARINSSLMNLGR